MVLWWSLITIKNDKLKLIMVMSLLFFKIIILDVHLV